MGYVLKGHRYRIVDNRSFELPLPVKYMLLKEDDEIAEYEINAKEEVSYKIITKYKENMITPITRPLTISDIYYFFSCRVFQDRTPFTGSELSLLGLERYNVYDIIRKTRGITPYDNYWLRFDGDKCAYFEAKEAWDELMSNAREAASEAAIRPAAAAGSNADINEILGQHKVDVASKMTEHMPQPAPEAAQAPAAAPARAPEPEPEPEPSGSNTMSADEIEALLMKSGLSSGFDMPGDKPEEDSKPQSSGGKMNQDDIEKMLAGVGAAVEEAAPAPAPEEPKSSGGKMSQDDIEKMLAAASEAVQEPLISDKEPEQPALDLDEPAPAPEAPKAEEKPAAPGGKMSQADIEALLNGMADDAK